MHQTWGKLLFMHWSIPAERLRPLIPAPLSIDTFDGEAWIGVIPFTIWGARPLALPPIPGLSAFHELNVRTYVHYRGVPGVWFFSLDASSRLAVWAARRFYHLPYRVARMALEQDNNRIDYSSERTESGFPPANLKTSWSIGQPLESSQPGSLQYFLTERYCLYAENRGSLFRCRIFHRPWPLKTASLHRYESTMVESLGLAEPSGEPLLHYAEKLSVEIWPLRQA
jgi:uncharacterized protein YqjF (DUF2071 family)